MKKESLESLAQLARIRKLLKSPKTVWQHIFLLCRVVPSYPECTVASTGSLSVDPFKLVHCL